MTWWPQPHNISGIFEMFAYVENASGNLFSLLFIIVMYTISFVSVKIGGLETDKSFLFASFITFAIGSVFWAAGFVPGKIMVILLVLVVFSFIYYYISQK